MSDIDVVKDMFERGIIKCRLSNLSITNWELSGSDPMKKK